MSSLKSLSLPLEPKISSVHTTWDLGPKACFIPQLISCDKRSRQQIKSELLCGSAELFTQATSQADLYLPWFSFAILIFRNKNGSITLKKKNSGMQSFQPLQKPRQNPDQIQTFQKEPSKQTEHHCMMLSALQLPVVKREPWFLETTKAHGVLEGALGNFCLWALPGNCFLWDVISYF